MDDSGSRAARAAGETSVPPAVGGLPAAENVSRVNAVRAPRSQTVRAALFAGCPVARIVSGGQTGVDRGALDAAVALGIPHGGWCPRGRRAEDGRVPLRYDLRETESSRYDIRTERNILDADGTLILHEGPLTAGTALTRRLAAMHGKPLRLVDLTAPLDDDAVRHWLLNAKIGVLNVAGPRESSSPGIAGRAQAALERLLRDETGEPTDIVS
jgi:hypothetical protein